jgi:glycosyltransferase involved in cell wall biosynthesis
VVFLGHRPDVHQVLTGFDLFVLASHREGQPRAAMEAAATGLPIIATDIRGCRQVVDNEVTGLLVPVADSGALSDAIRSLADDPDRRAAMGLAGLAKARAEFDERDVVTRVMDCYRRVAARKEIALPLPTLGSTAG